MAVNVIPGAGQAVSLALGSISASLGAAAVTTITSIGIGAAASTAAGALAKNPRVTLNQLDRLNASINPSAPRKIVFGHTAMPIDIRYVEPEGPQQEYISYIICVAGHRIGDVIQMTDEEVADLV